mmetsp:Transcript_2545/g.5675  ORF Transcript_2545/g.5675 Transcript_2545/m.5675 type:complete len:401 (-) Transcript_2545:444-1646(-)
MGGHGGLNILPQKSWHVYNRDNRFKVAQDEAKAREKEQEEAERHQNAEREYRRQQLLERARGQQQAHLLSGSLKAEAPAPAADGQLVAAASLEHINFWKEEELKLKAQHPDVEKQKREELRKRGNPDTYTTDAKFDERFQLGYGLVGGSKPWYAQAPSRGAEEDAAPSAPGVNSSSIALQPTNTIASGQQHAHPILGVLHQQPLLQAGRAAAAAARPSTSDSRSSSESGSDSDSSSSSSSSSSSFEEERSSKRKTRSRSNGKRKRRQGSGSSKKRRRRERSSSSSSSESDSDSESTHGSSSDSEGAGRSRHKGRRGRKESKRTRHKSKRSGKRHRKSKEGAGGGGLKSVEQLRAERLQREAQERERARRVMIGAMEPAGEPKGYNSAFGYAAGLQKKPKH